MLTFIQDIDCKATRNLQTGVLLTGVNQTDHIQQFHSLSLKIANNCHSVVTVIQSRDCPNIKSAVEALVGGLIRSDDDDTCLKKKQLTFPVLEAWYKNKYKSKNAQPSLVVMIADFEQFNSSCIQDLISIMCSFVSRVPLVLVVGIATAFKALHNVLPAHITNKLDASVFQSEPSTVMLNKILEETILNHKSSLQMSGKSLKTLMDIFLFYDYSLHSFVQGYKAFMLEHFYNHPQTSLLLIADDDNINEFKHEECENIRKSCPSFRKLVDTTSDPQYRIDLINNDEVLKIELIRSCANFEEYLVYFYFSLRILVVLLEDLPRNELGKHLRELFAICSTSDVTKLDEYKECLNLLKFTSKDKFLNKLDNVIAVVQTFLDDKLVSEACKKNINDELNSLNMHRTNIKNAGMSPQKEEEKSSKKATTPHTKAMNRQEMMAGLKESAKNNPQRVLIEYEQRLWDCISFLNELMEKYLLPISEATVFNEFFVFNDCHSVRRQIVGAPRGNLHNALFNPQHYLQCSCCNITENEQILSTHPECSIAYKLHLENNKFINLFDWLQSFAMVAEESSYDDDEITPEIQ